MINNTNYSEGRCKTDSKTSATLRAILSQKDMLGSHWLKIINYMPGTGGTGLESQQRQEDLWEFEARLVYKENAKRLQSYTDNPVLKQANRTISY